MDGSRWLGGIKGLQQKERRRHGVPEMPSKVTIVKICGFNKAILMP